MGSRAWPPAKVPFVLVESLGRGGEDDLVPGADGGSWFFFVKYPFMDVHGGVPVTRNGPFGVPDPAASLYTAVPSRDGRFIGVFWLGEVVHRGPWGQLPPMVESWGQIFVKVVAPVSIGVVFGVFFQVRDVAAGPEKVGLDCLPVFQVWANPRPLMQSSRSWLLIRPSP